MFRDFLCNVASSLYGHPNLPQEPTPSIPKPAPDSRLWCAAQSHLRSQFSEKGADTAKPVQYTLEWKPGPRIAAKKRSQVVHLIRVSKPQTVVPQSKHRVLHPAGPSPPWCRSGSACHNLAAQHWVLCTGSLPHQTASLLPILARHLPRPSWGSAKQHSTTTKGSHGWLSSVVRFLASV